MDNNAPLILLAAGGTGGHLFPAEALGVELIRRGLRVRLATDDRALRYSGLFTRDNIDVVPSETVRGRSLLALARTVYTLCYGTVVASRLLRRRGSRGASACPRWLPCLPAPDRGRAHPAVRSRSR